MPYPLTIAAAMRDINRSAILEILRRESPISCTTIVERLEVSLPAVMRIVDELIADGLVRPGGGSEWSGGRRRTWLEFNADRLVVLGVDLGITKIYGATANLGGSILDDAQVELQRRASVEDYYRALQSLIDALLASLRLEGRSVRGIGLGAPGITLHSEGIVKGAYTPDPLRINGTIPSLPKPVVFNLGLWAGVMGAITNMLQITSNFYVVHKLSKSDQEVNAQQSIRYACRD